MGRVRETDRQGCAGEVVIHGSQEEGQAPPGGPKSKHKAQPGGRGDRKHGHEPRPGFCGKEQDRQGGQAWSEQFQGPGT